MADTNIAAETTDLTGFLADRAAALEWNMIPPAIAELAKDCIRDWLGVGIAGAGEPLVQILADTLEAGKAGGSASLLGRPAKCDILTAALVNGAASHVLDFDDGNMLMIGHTSVAVLPALLALAEQRGSSGVEILTAYVAGYETGSRLGAAVCPEHYQIGFHSTATIGIFACAAACGRLLRLSPLAMRRALGLAGAQSAGLKAMFGTMGKPFQVGRATQNGLLAALLAERDFTSTENIIDCRQGFADAMVPEFRPERGFADPPDGFYLIDNVFKFHASCLNTHAIIEGVGALRQQHRIDPAAVTAIRLTVGEDCRNLCDIVDPKSSLEAKFSLHLAAAFGLAGEDTGRLSTYAPETFRTPAIDAIRRKVSLEYERGRPITTCQIGIVTAADTFASAYSIGGSAYKAAQRKRLQSKFMSLVAPIIGEARAMALDSAIGRLDQAGTAADLFGLSLTESR